MIYDIRHVTDYSYEVPVSSAKLALRLTPRDGGGQHCESHALQIVPQPSALITELDFFGNAVTIATIDHPMTDLSVEMRARVEVSRPPSLASGMSPAWDDIRQRALASRSLGADSPTHFIFPSPRVALFKPIADYCALSFPRGERIVDGVRDLAARIRNDFDYAPASTEISTPLDHSFAERRGVCQDFAHIMISGLRSLGIPAAYVSGYIRTIAAPGAVRLEGADATHAWVSVWCGEETGWFGVDPTNAIDAGDDHIVLAQGRDFSDVSPIYGVFHGSGAQELKVGVDVIPVR